MSGVQVLVLAACVVNVLWVAVRLDGMTWRTHRWGPMLQLMLCGIAAAGGGWLGWVGADMEFSLCLQVAVLCVLLHLRAGLPAEWKPAQLRAVRVDDREAM